MAVAVAQTMRGQRGQRRAVGRAQVAKTFCRVLHLVLGQEGMGLAQPRHAELARPVTLAVEAAVDARDGLRGAVGEQRGPGRGQALAEVGLVGVQMAGFLALRRAHHLCQRRQALRARRGGQAQQQEGGALGRAEAVAVDLVANAALQVQCAQHVEIDQRVHAAHQHIGAIAPGQPRGGFAQCHQAGRAAVRCGDAARGIQQARRLLVQVVQEVLGRNSFGGVVLRQAQQQGHGSQAARQGRQGVFQCGMRQAQHACLAWLQRQRLQRGRQRRQAVVGHGADDEGLAAAVAPRDLAQAGHTGACRGRGLGQAEADGRDHARAGDDDVGPGHGAQTVASA